MLAGFWKLGSLILTKQSPCGLTCFIGERNLAPTQYCRYLCVVLFISTVIVFGLAFTSLLDCYRPYLVSLNSYWTYYKDDCLKYSAIKKRRSLLPWDLKTLLLKEWIFLSWSAGDNYYAILWSIVKCHNYRCLFRFLL